MLKVSLFLRKDIGSKTYHGFSFHGLKNFEHVPQLTLYDLSVKIAQETGVTTSKALAFVKQFLVQDGLLYRLTGPQILHDHNLFESFFYN